MPIRNWTKIISRLALLAFALVGLAYLPQITLAQQVGNDAAKAADILAQVNAWRLENQLWPLTVNPTLEALALAQANYVLPNVLTIDDENLFHVDAKQRNPRQRGAAAGWPIYGTNPEHIEIGENAGVGGSKFVMNFWKTSPIHAKAALSNTYREVGVAALPVQGRGYFYIMDFGARPGVLPVVVSADGKSLWLTEEKSRYAPKVTGNTKFRLLDGSGKPLTDLANWSLSIPIPDNATGDIQVVYISGDATITTAISRGGFTTGPAATATTVVGPTPTPGVAAVNPTQIPSTRAPDVTPTFVAPVATALPSVNPASADLLLTYDSQSLFVRNNNKSTVDISGLSLIGSGVTVGVPLWSKVGEFPAAAFPSSHCLGVELATADVSIPSTCKWTRAIVNLTPAKLFWTQGDFMVSLNGTALAICKPSDGQCAIDLP